MTSDRNIGYYEEFEIIDKKLLAKAIEGYHRSIWSMLRTINYHVKAVCTKFIGDAVENSHDLLVCATVDKKQFEQVRDFCAYLKETNVLLDLTVKHIIENSKNDRNDLDPFTKELEIIYEHYVLNKELGKKEDSKISPKKKI